MTPDQIANAAAERVRELLEHECLRAWPGDEAIARIIREAIAHATLDAEAKLAEAERRAEWAELVSRAVASFDLKREFSDGRWMVAGMKGDGIIRYDPIQVGLDVNGLPVETPGLKQALLAAIKEGGTNGG